MMEVAQAQERLVEIPAGHVMLQGSLILPEQARGVVLFVHGGSGRYSPHDTYIAGVLQVAGLGTLRFDLLTGEEEAADASTDTLQFHIGLLAQRLVAATDWLNGQLVSRDLQLGYMASGIGVAAALVAAAERPGTVHALVARDGRPDLAGVAISCVQAPTLLIVGTNDPELLRVNREGWLQLETEKELSLLRGAPDLPTDPGSLPQVARQAGDWFLRFLSHTRS